ncbi:MAG: cupin, partial [Cyanobacteria bacterium P01_H01_bin.15]
AIHSVEPLGDEPAVTFNLYGETDFAQRFEFDALKHTAWNF